MKILYSGVRFENYDPKRRNSFEYVNFYSTLKSMEKNSGLKVLEHPFDRILDVGKKKWNEELLELTRREKPNILFAFMYTDELEPATLLRIRDEIGVKTVAWFADDYWRFWNYSKHWPPYFSYVVTTYSKAVEWYKKSGFNNAIFSQWACNTALYKPVGVEKDIDVSFVGQKKSGRVKVIEALRALGIDVKCFGYGWPASHASGVEAGVAGGKISHDEMLQIFSRSKICLNLTDRKSLWDLAVIARLFLKKSINRIVPDFHLLDNFMAYLYFPTPHTHARPFELAGCGAFVISGCSEDIGKYYEDGKEMVFYDSPQDLAEKIKYYLSHEKEREAIAKAGYERTIKEHTYEKRFQEIFAKIGIS